MRILFILLIAFVVSGRANAQSTDNLVEQGIALEKQFKVKEALQKFEQALLQDSKNQQALWRASRMYSNIGGHEKEKSLKRENYIKAKTYAVQSIQLDPASIDARFSHIISLGLLAEIAGNPREKIRDAKIIRQEAEAIISLDTTYAPVYFVMGKWHYELAKLSWIEQMACDFFFGGLPEDVSMEKASNHFKKASTLDPDNILFLYGEASVYHYEKDYTRASQLLDRALALTPREPDDILRKEKCQALRNQIRKES